MCDNHTHIPFDAEARDETDISVGYDPFSSYAEAARDLTLGEEPHAPKVTIVKPGIRRRRTVTNQQAMKVLPDTTKEEPSRTEAPERTELRVVEKPVVNEERSAYFASVKEVYIERNKRRGGRKPKNES